MELNVDFGLLGPDSGKAGEPVKPVKPVSELSDRSVEIRDSLHLIDYMRRTAACGDQPITKQLVVWAGVRNYGPYGKVTVKSNETAAIAFLAVRGLITFGRCLHTSLSSRDREAGPVFGTGLRTTYKVT